MLGRQVLCEGSGAKFVPGGLNVQFTKDALLKDEFDEWLARIICYAFSTSCRACRPTAFVKQDEPRDGGERAGYRPAGGPRAAAELGQSLPRRGPDRPRRGDRVLAEDFAAPEFEFQLE